MRNIINRTFKFILIIESMVFSWVILNGLLAYNKISYEFNPIILIMGICIYILLICFFYKKLLIKLANIRYIEYIMFVFFTILSIITGVYFRVNPGWDMGACFEIAERWATYGIGPENYLAQFPNNVMMTMIDFVVVKIFSIFGIREYVLGITILTALIIASSVIFGFYVVKKVFSREKAILYMMICLFTTPLYLYATEYYTDTFSMLTAVLLLYLWINNKKDVVLKRKIINDIVYGIVLFLAIKIKLTSAFVIIAIVMYEFVQGDINKYLKKLGIILTTTIVFTVSFNFLIVNKVATKEARDLYEIPKEHWIMMGMNGVGSFSFEEYAYTKSPENKTFEDRKRATREKIAERIKTRSLNEHTKNITSKLGFAWHEGTYFISIVLVTNPCKDRLLHKFVLRDGEYNKYYKYFPQIMHFSMLIFIFVNLCRIIKNNSFKSAEIITILTIFGVMIFLIIWENRSRYLVNIIPLMIISQINGIEYMADIIKKKDGKG